jgi:predicted dinucleotide-binding enzyme
VQITILGAGNMSRGIATRLLAGSHEVHILDRDAGHAATLVDELRGVSEGRVSPGTLGDDLVGEIVILAVPYVAASRILKEYYDRLADKILVDITNPINATYDGLSVAADTSAGQEIAKATPESTRVVKAFNTTFAGTLLSGEVAGHPLDVLLAGDDADAKATIAKLIEMGGMRPLDVGPLVRARYLEGMGLMHIMLQFSMGTGFGSAVKILS